jgi:hypothetical protein
MRRCQAKLSEIDIPRPFDLDAFVRQIGQQRNRRVVLHPWSNENAGDGLCGAWIATNDEDHLYYERATNPAHQAHVIFHEVAHMLFGHTLRANTDAGPRLMPDLDPDMIRRVLMLARTTYLTPEEQEAELLATVIGDAAARAAAPTGTLGRLQTALGGWRGSS